ncbi:MAG: alpha/beta hydrolase [Vicinamibacterales bacterium]
MGGVRLHLHATGKAGPTVVFDAALGASSVSWTFVQREVIAFARACTYDRAGFGWSEGGAFPRTAGRIADELRLLLEKAGERPPFVLVGHSYGGLVMRIFAHRYRHDTAALVLVDPAQPEDWVTPAPKEQVLIDKGVQLCRQGAFLAKYGVARVIAALVGLGVMRPARLLTRMVTRGRFARADENVLAPMWKLPPEVRRPLRRFWSQKKFFDALGSQIEMMPVSAAETLEAGSDGYGDLPLVTISASNPGDYRLRQQEALARLSTRGRHVLAHNSGHWIPLDDPATVVAVIAELCIELDVPRARTN